jgi:ribonuclease HII
VTVGAFAFLRRGVLPTRVGRIPLRDSKRLSPKVREQWLRIAKEHAGEGAVVFTTARVSARLVDRMNIARAANLAATRAYERLIVRSGINPASAIVLLDGGLFIRPRGSLAPHRTRTIVRGDEKVPEIQLASIVAKVTRDRAMVRFHRRYPSYGLAAHKGYGTRAHRRALLRHGLIKGFHRLTFV